MRAIKFVALGSVVWSLSLLWPEINKVLTVPVAVALVLGLGIVELLFIFDRHSDRGGTDKRDDTHQNHSSCPIPAALPR